MLRSNLASRCRHGLTGFSVRHSVDHHHALVAKTDAAIHSTGVFLLLRITEGPPSGRHKNRSRSLAFIGYKLFTVHLNLESLSSPDPFPYSTAEHLYFVPTLYLGSTLTLSALHANAIKKGTAQATIADVSMKFCGLSHLPGMIGSLVGTFDKSLDFLLLHGSLD